jgi:hypothetical protein
MGSMGIVSFMMLIVS